MIRALPFNIVKISIQLSDGQVIPLCGWLVKEYFFKDILDYLGALLWASPLTCSLSNFLAQGEYKNAVMDLIQFLLKSRGAFQFIA